jgi:hypothetical protein
VEKVASPLSDWEKYSLGGIGPEFILRTYNGNITITKYQKAQ